jgi:hypothetical protein
MRGASKWSLGLDVVKAIPQAKVDLRMNRLHKYDGDELITRPGGTLYVAYVGHARPGDPRGADGNRRLVLRVECGRITEMYFSDNHYRPGSWSYITNF